MKNIFVLLLFLSAVLSAVLSAARPFTCHAQQSTGTAPASGAPPRSTETMVVLGTAVPVPLAESTAPVELIPAQPELLLVESAQDLLRSDASVALQERGAGGGQADVVLRGGGFEQTLVLLNGFRVNDSQTGHHNLDLPLPLAAINSIQVLHGAGSTLHGADALSGVVDFVTAPPTTSSILLRAGEGSFESNEESVLGDWSGRRLSSRLAAEREFSTGFITDRDYRNEDAANESWIATRLGITDLMVAASDRSFGANQFYGPYNSWERTKAWIATARQEIGARAVAAFGYRRHTDEFVLLRNLPSVYENNHIDGSWQASLRYAQPVAASSTLLLGLESDGDSIRSNNLGLHARNRGAGYADLDLRPAKSRWKLSVGAREEVFSGGITAFAPHLAASLGIAGSVKLRAGGGYGFRIPTYTDLYYSDPATVGNSKLKPESAWSGEGGVDWAASRSLSITATGFYARQHDTLDYARPLALPNPLLPAQCTLKTWCAVNVSGLHFSGVEASATWLPAKGQIVRLAWTGLIGKQPPLPELQSEYALNYPAENGRLQWVAALGHQLTLSDEVRVVKPYQQAGNPAWNTRAYAVWNASVARETGGIRPYLRFSNLSNTGYQEINGVNMQGRSISGGFAYFFSR